MERIDYDLERYEKKQMSGEELHQEYYENLEMLLEETLEELQRIIESTSRYDFVTYSDTKKLVIDILKRDL
ncbi:MAG: hypothetical protein JHC33_03395 [Ignisphaera sp.]|nr:hypothetical protein [Ignisphaera sp.]